MSAEHDEVVTSQTQQGQQGQQRQQRPQRSMDVEKQPAVDPSIADVEAQQHKEDEEQAQLAARLKQTEHSVMPTDAERVQKHFNYVMQQLVETVGEKPHMFHLCHNHRAAVINHIGEVTNDNAVMVDTHQCLLCQYPINA